MLKTRVAKMQCAQNYARKYFNSTHAIFFVSCERVVQTCIYMNRRLRCVNRDVCVFSLCLDARQPAREAKKDEEPLFQLFHHIAKNVETFGSIERSHIQN